MHCRSPAEVLPPSVSENFNGREYPSHWQHLNWNTGQVFMASMLYQLCGIFDFAGFRLCGLRTLHGNLDCGSAEFPQCKYTVQILARFCLRGLKYCRNEDLLTMLRGILNFLLVYLVFNLFIRHKFPYSNLRGTSFTLERLSTRDYLPNHHPRPLPILPPPHPVPPPPRPPPHHRRRPHARRAHRRPRADGGPACARELCGVLPRPAAAAAASLLRRAPPALHPSPSEVHIETSDAAFTVLHAVQPPSLAAARAHYALKTSRPPPRGFDAFYAFAREHNCLVDAYDDVHADLAPFWQAERLAGRGWFRRRVREVAERLKNDPRGRTALTIRDGVVHRPNYQGTYFEEDWERTINKAGPSSDTAGIPCWRAHGERQGGAPGMVGGGGWGRRWGEQGVSEPLGAAGILFLGRRLNFWTTTRMARETTYGPDDI
ncbi:hypothetical protein DFH09DRAFT_1106306 [Mycena vulgaris]|nr:hypothetical protein DFH09DRAFT_1106306 [Mycena vulgaris]